MFLHGLGPAIEGNKVEKKIFKAQGIHPASGRIPAEGSSIKRNALA